MSYRVLRITAVVLVFSACGRKEPDSPAAKTAEPAAAPILLCLGDSLTAGYGVDRDQAWPALTGRKVIPYIGVAAHESWIEKNKSTIRKLFAAYKDAESYLNKNPDDAARIIAEGFNLPKEVIGSVIAKGRLRIRVGWANDMADDFAAVWKAGREAGILKGIPDSNILYRP